MRIWSPFEEKGVCEMSVVVSYLIDNKSLENVDIAMVLTLQLHLTSFLHPWLSYRSWCVLEQQVPNQVFL